jgi:hypothetical protein
MQVGAFGPNLGLTQTVAGADIKEIAYLDSEAARKCRYLEDLCQGMARVRKPLIAAVEGLAVGPLNALSLDDGAADVSSLVAGSR